MITLFSTKPPSSIVQIIQLAPSSQHGQFFAWVIVEGVMLKIPITVPRVFYLNSKAPITEEFPGRRVNKTLPHGHHSYNLIEVPTELDLKLLLQSKISGFKWQVFEVFSVLSFFWCLLQIIIDEDQFRGESRKLAAHLADPEVEVSIFHPIFTFIVCMTLFNENFQRIHIVFLSLELGCSIFYSVIDSSIELRS